MTVWNSLGRGWRASHVSTLSVKEQLPAVRVNAEVLEARRSVPLATPRPVPVCGAIDSLTGAVCTQPATHPPVPVRERSAAPLAWKWMGQHVDLSDPSAPIVWPDDEYTIRRPA